MGIAIRCNGLAFDELHDQIRRAIIVGAAVKQPRDIRVFQIGKNLALVAEQFGAAAR